MRIQYAKIEAGGLHNRKDRLSVSQEGSGFQVQIADFEFEVLPTCIAASASGSDVEIYVENAEIHRDKGIARCLVPASSGEKGVIFCLDWSCPDGDWEDGASIRNLDIEFPRLTNENYVDQSDHVALLEIRPKEKITFRRTWETKSEDGTAVVWVQMAQNCYLLNTGNEVVLKMDKTEEVGMYDNNGKPVETPKSTSTALVVVPGTGTPKKAPVTFNDVIGQEEAKTALRKLVKYLHGTRRLAELDAEMPHGVLMLGDPGNGKTMLARALANEADIPFISINAGTLISPYSGESTKNVVKLFNSAREKKAPVIVFLDEIDTVGCSRKDNDKNRAECLTALLTEMDGFDNNQYPIVVLGATNRPETLDQALLRAGRFDRKIALRNPKFDDMLKLLQHYSRNFKLAADVDLEVVARKIAGMPASSAKNVCNEAALMVFDADESGRKGVKVGQEMLLKAAAQETREHIGSSKGRRFNANDNSIKLADVIGQDGAKTDVQDVINYLRDPQSFHDAGASIPKGLLMVGGPGQGKTRLARAVAGEADVPFFSISGSDFVEKYVGVGASRVRELFAEARRNAPCIIFIDEIDAVGKKRAESSEGGGNSEYEQTLNALLTEMDGFDPQSEPIVILAATNRKDALDPALVRPGRLDREAAFHDPNVEDRLKLFQYYTRNKKLASRVNLEFFARNTYGFSAASIEAVCNEATLLMLREGAKEITAKHLDDAITRTTMGAARKLGNVSKQELMNTAVHEGGHAVVGWFAGRNKIARITVLPYGGSLGHVQQMRDDKHSMYFQEMKERIAMCLGGRAATDIILNEVDSGPSSDFQKARAIAYQMVTEYGMSKLGPMTAIKGVERSDKERAAIEKEVNAIIKECDDMARAIINEHREELDALVKRVLRKETVLGPEFEKIMAGKRSRSRSKVKTLTVV